jgi:isochorismate synthase EntC
MEKHCTGGYAIAVEPEPGVALIAPTPARLYHRRAAEVGCEVQAGFAQRGETRKEDARHADALLESAQASLEHEGARLAVQEALRSVCTSVGALPSPVVRSGPDGHRICTTVKGQLEPGTGDAPLLARLHPGPLGWGVPADAALDYLRKADSFDRGMLGGFIGCLGHEESDVALVASAALQQRTDLDVLTTVGVVRDVDLAAKWQEVSAVLRLYTSALEG